MTTSTLPENILEIERRHERFAAQREREGFDDMAAAHSDRAALLSYIRSRETEAPRCVNCGATKPCMTEADLKPGEPGTPCTFDPLCVERAYQNGLVQGRAMTPPVGLTLLENLRDELLALSKDDFARGHWNAGQNFSAQAAGVTKAIDRLTAATPSTPVGLTEEERRKINEDFERAMAPRQNPKYPIFRDHNCWKCGDGERPCVDGNYATCSNPHARND